MPVINSPFTRATGTTAPAGALTPSGSIQRQPGINQLRNELGERAKNGEASSAIFLPTPSIRYDAYAFDYHTGMSKQMNLTKEPADGKVKGTIVINVSGHSNEAERFAKSNTYSVEVRLPDGKTLNMRGIPRNDPSKAEYATLIDIEFPYQKGVTTLVAWPDGSAGGGGYIEGRRYQIHSPDQPFVTSSTTHKAYSDS
jgi:hypothetical protein